METKVCKKCGEEKELSKFYKDKGFKDGHKATCKECNNKAHKGICELCGEEFESSKKNQKYCSIKCLTDTQKKRVKFNCDYCGKECEVAECLYRDKENHYCSKDCRSKHHSILMRGDRHPNYNSIQITCDFCGKEIVRKLSKVDDRNFCDINCYAEYRKIHYSGENHSSWNGGEVEIFCDCCGKKILRKKSQIRENNYCSTECMGIGRKTLYSGKNNANWGGGITNISEYLRHNINDWKLDSFKKHNYRCDISGNSKNLVIHHLYNFKDIISELFEVLDIEVHSKIRDYTEAQLNILKDKCLELHYKYGLGVCLTEEFHKEFHSIYGKKDNTPDQYYEFKEKKNKRN